MALGLISKWYAAGATQLNQDVLYNDERHVCQATLICDNMFTVSSCAMHVLK